MSELIIAEKEDIVNIADAVRTQTGKTTSMSLDEIANEISTLSANGSSTQADWQQNDESAPDYIKNRTHWIEQSFIELLPEIEVYDSYVDLYDVPLFSKLSPNANCAITIDGVVYKDIVARHYTYNAYEWYIIGNGDLCGEEEDTYTDLPFGLYIDKYEENWGQTDNEISTIKIDAVGETVHKIPEMYLPTKIGIEGTGAYSEIFNNLSKNVASGDYSRAENFETTASGFASNAQGLSTTASGYGSHSQGCGSQATAPYSHAEGYYTQASGSYSHAEGTGTIAQGENQHVSGSYNVADSTSLVIIGNGTTTGSKSNAYKLSKDGTGWYANGVEVSSAILRSSTPGSTKTFKLTVDDSGTLSITEIT